jgi:hypothetical protein
LHTQNPDNKDSEDEEFLFKEKKNKKKMGSKELENENALDIMEKLEKSFDGLHEFIMDQKKVPDHVLDKIDIVNGYTTQGNLRRRRWSSIAPRTQHACRVDKHEQRRCEDEDSCGPEETFVDERSAQRADANADRNDNTRRNELKRQRRHRELQKQWIRRSYLKKIRSTRYVDMYRVVRRTNQR